MMADNERESGPFCQPDEEVIVPRERQQLLRRPVGGGPARLDLEPGSILSQVTCHGEAQ